MVSAQIELSEHIVGFHPGLRQCGKEGVKQDFVADLAFRNGGRGAPFVHDSGVRVRVVGWPGRRCKALVRYLMGKQSWSRRKVTHSWPNSLDC